MSGGKGGSQSSQVQIPAYMEDALKQQLDRAQAVQNIGYVPIMGPTMAGFTSGQKAGMESQAALAQRMGIIPQSYDVTSGYMPGATDVGGGLTAYDSYTGAKQRVEDVYAAYPEIQRKMEAIYGPQSLQDIQIARQIEEARAAGVPQGTLDMILARTNNNGGNDQGYQAPGYDVPVSESLRGIGFGAYDMPSPALNFIGGQILDAQIEAEARRFNDLPTTTGGNGGGSSMGSGVSPSDAPGTPF